MSLPPRPHPQGKDHSFLYGPLLAILPFDRYDLTSRKLLYSLACMVVGALVTKPQRKWGQLIIISMGLDLPDLNLYPCLV